MRNGDDDAVGAADTIQLLLETTVEFAPAYHEFAGTAGQLRMFIYLTLAAMPGVVFVTDPPVLDSTLPGEPEASH